MQYTNVSDRARETIVEFLHALNQAQPNDEVIFNLYDREINALLKAGLIEPEPLRGWFSQIFGCGIQYRVTQGYPNIIIYKRTICK